MCLWHTLICRDLANNKIEDLPIDSFVGQDQLQQIILKNNKITDIQKGIFDPLTSVQIL